MYFVIAWILTVPISQYTLTDKYLEKFPYVDKEYFPGTQNFFKNRHNTAFSKNSIFTIVIWYLVENE